MVEFGDSAKCRGLGKLLNGGGWGICWMVEFGTFADWSSLGDLLNGKV